MSLIFFFNDTATTEIYTLSLHDALPILDVLHGDAVDLTDLGEQQVDEVGVRQRDGELVDRAPAAALEDVDADHVTVDGPRSEEHTSELQSHLNLVCRLLLVKKNEPLQKP